MRPRFAGGAAIFIAAILVAVVAAVLLVRKARPKPFATLPGGIRITVEGVTFGTNHHFTTDSKIKTGLRKVLPPSLKRFIPAGYAFRRQTDHPQTFVHLTAFDPATGTYLNQSWDRFRIIDEHGCRWPVAYAFAPVGLTAFPRRMPTFKLHAVASGGASVDLLVPNPVHGPFPHWTAESLPVRRPAQNLTFELSRIESYDARFGDEGTRYFFTPVFHVFRDDVDVTREWRSATEFLDETGNRSEVPCPYEPVWKVEAKFYRTPKASFPEDQIWRISGLRIPDNGTSMALNHLRKVGNTEVQLLALAGPGQFHFTDGVIVSNAPWAAGMVDTSSARTYVARRRLGTIVIDFTQQEPSILISFAPRPTFDEVLLRQTDQTGRQVDVPFFQASGDKSRYILAFKLPPQSNSTNIDLELILQKPIILQFPVRPPKPSPREGAKRSEPRDPLVAVAR